MFRRLLLAGAVLVAASHAGPSLTTIQDVLYKADGTRFNGTLTISWSSFQAADNSAVVTQSTTIKVLDGNLRVQLIPVTTANPPATYTVTYNSDGRIQFKEIWSVPASASPLRVRDVRVATSSGNSSSGADTGSSPVAESAVVGLLSDLGARPVKGPGFSAGRVLLVDSAGLLESAGGTASDCLHVDGSSGPCGSTETASFVDGEAPSGIVDGSNATFGLSAAPTPTTSLAIYRNGLLQKAGSDFTLSGQTVQFVAAAIPQPGDTLLASYRLGGGSSLSSGNSASEVLYANPQVLCSGAGAAAGSTSLASVGTCSIPAGVLTSGDRVEIRFDLDHQGTTGGFSFEVHWGSTVALHRDAAANETVATGRVDAAILASTAQWSTQSWGALLAFGATAGKASDPYASGLTIDFQSNAATGDTVTLRNYSVVRIP
jgi:hypothetical protein